MAEIAIRIVSPRKMAEIINPRVKPKTVHKKEPVRDWAFSLLTGHRVLVVFWMISITIALYLLQMWIWPNSREAITIFEKIWAWLSIVWITAVIPGTFGLMGMLRYRHPEKLDSVKPINNLVSF